MTSQDMTQDTGPGEDDEVVVAELVEDAGALEPRVPVVGVDPAYVDLYRRLRAEGGVDLQEQLHNRYLQLARGGVTPGGLPWPSPTDPVAEGADAIRALAEALTLTAASAPTPEAGWGLYLDHPSGGLTGSPYVARASGGFVVVRLVFANTTAAPVSVSTGAIVGRGFPRSSVSVTMPLAIYGPPLASSPGPVNPNLSAYVNQAGVLYVRGSATIAPGVANLVAGIYPYQAS